ncbi:hypothetical protein VULLAG_LOCUS12880 [Vulpes lagopus]
MYGAAGPPARSASAPVVRALRRPPPPATGSVGKGPRAGSGPYGGPRWPRGAGVGADYRVRAAGAGRAWRERHVPGEETWAAGPGHRRLGLPSARRARRSAAGGRCGRLWGTDSAFDGV